MESKSVALLLIAIALVVGLTTGYFVGHGIHYREGFTVGYSSGYVNGYNIGLKACTCNDCIGALRSCANADKCVITNDGFVFTETTFGNMTFPNVTAVKGL